MIVKKGEYIMRKRGKKLVAMALATSMALGTVSMQAFADEPVVNKETISNEDGTTTEITTTTATDSNATPVTVTVTVKQDTKDSEGNLLSSTVDGTETKEWTEEVKPGQEVPEVNVTIQYEKNEDGSIKLDENGKPIIILSGSITDTSEPEVTDNLASEGGSTEEKSNITTTTTTTDRVVTGSGTMEESFVIDPDESSLECPIDREEYEGKQYYDKSEDYCDKTDPKDVHYREGLLNGYTKDDIEYAVADKPDKEGYDKGYDLTWTGHGDTTNAASAIFVEEIVYLTDDKGEIVYENGFPVVDMEKSKFVHGQNGKSIGDSSYKQESGMVSSIGQFALKHENGEYFYAYCMDASTGASPSVNRWYNIRNLEDAIYSSENPDGYLTKEEAAQIRAIATYGYWGTNANVYETNEDGTIKVDNDGNRIVKKDDEGNIITDSSVRGSVASLKALLKETYNEDSIINVRYPGSNEAHPYKIYELIDGLTEAEALAVTQAAIWTYANNEDVTYRKNNGEVLVSGASVIGILSASKYHNTRKDPSDPAYDPRWLNEYKPAMDGESDARLLALYQCLLSLDPIYADGGLREDSTVIPNEGVIEEMAMVIKDKAEDEAANFDDNKDNDVFNTEINFKLAFVPGENDEMYVCLMDDNDKFILDEDGQPIKKLLASETSTKTGDNVIKPVNGVYTLSGLKVSENSDFVFDLKLEGTQYLNEGVYIYQAEGGRKESQTLVGLAKGEQKVEVSTVMTINFNVDEENHVVAEREWHEEETTTPDNGGGNDGGGDNGGNGGGSTPSDPNPVTPQVAAETFEIEESEVPLSDGVSVLGAFEIEDDMIPLGVLPATGDNSLWLMIVSLFSGLSLAGASFVDKMKKRRR